MYIIDYTGVFTQLRQHSLSSKLIISTTSVNSGKAVALTIDFRITELICEYLVSDQEWTKGVKLKLNYDQIEFIIISDKHSREPLIPKFPATFLHI